MPLKSCHKHKFYITKNFTTTAGKHGTWVMKTEEIENVATG